MSKIATMSCAIEVRTASRRSRSHPSMLEFDGQLSAQILTILTDVEFSKIASEQTPWRYGLPEGGKV